MDDSEIKNTVCDFGNLYKAMYKCKRNVMWKDSVAGFVKNGLINCYKLKQSLENDTYTISPYSQFKVYEPKERDIVSTRIKDRVVQRSLYDNYLYETVSKSFIRDSCACQIGKGTDDARDRLTRHLHWHFRRYGLNGGILKCDLKNYFGSTPHSIAIQAMDSRVPDEWALNQIIRVIKSFNQGANPDVGLGLGSQLTQLTELAVLDDLDHYIKEQLHIKCYVRYNDDFILIHQDLEYLNECLSLIHKRICEKGLQLSSKKTQIARISQPIHFLGFSFRLTETGKVIRKLLPEKVSQERRKLKRLVNLAKQGVITKKEVDDSYQTWKSHAEKGNTHNLILNMDQFYKELWR